MDKKYALELLETLKPKQKLVLILICRGKTREETALILGCSISNIDSHMTNIYEKLELDTEGLGNNERKALLQENFCSLLGLIMSQEELTADDSEISISFANAPTQNIRKPDKSTIKKPNVKTGLEIPPNGSGSSPQKTPIADETAENHNAEIELENPTPTSASSFKNTLNPDEQERIENAPTDSSSEISNPPAATTQDTPDTDETKEDPNTGENQSMGETQKPSPEVLETAANEQQERQEEQVENKAMEDKNPPSESTIPPQSGNSKIPEPVDKKRSILPSPTTSMTLIIIILLIVVAYLLLRRSPQIALNQITNTPTSTVAALGIVQSTTTAPVKIASEATDTPQIPPSPTFTLSPTSSPTPTATPSPTPTPSVTPQPTPVILFSDNFESKSPYWVYLQGEPTISNGALTADSPVWLAVGDPAWTNIKVEYKISVSNFADCRDIAFPDTSATVMLGFHVQDLDNMQALKTGTNCTVWFLAKNGQWKRVPGDMQPGLPARTWAKITLLVEGSKYTYKINDNQTVINWIDDTYTSGKVALLINKGTSIDDFVVSALP